MGSDPQEHINSLRCNVLRFVRGKNRRVQRSKSAKGRELKRVRRGRLRKKKGEGDKKREKERKRDMNPLGV